MTLSMEPESQKALRDEIVQVCQLLYQKNLIAATDGNVSARWGSGHLITTPSGVCKGLLAADDLLVTDLAGQPISTSGNALNGRKPSAELRMHLEIYSQRPDVQAVVHAHPPITTAFTVANVSLAPYILPETLVNMGTLVTSTYATPTSAQGPEVVRDLIRDHDALVLDRHGAVTVGASAMEAYFRMEKVENTALVSLVARLLGTPRTLPQEELCVLAAMRKAHFGEDSLDGELAEACSVARDNEASSDAGVSGLDVETIVRMVTRQVIEQLANR